MSDADDKLDAISNAGKGEVGEKRIRKRRTREERSADLREQLKKLGDVETKEIYKPEQLEKMFEGLYVAAQIITDLPFSECSKELKDGFCQAGTDCANVFMPYLDPRWVAVGNLSLFASFMTLEALQLKMEKKERERKEKLEHDT